MRLFGRESPVKVDRAESIFQAPLVCPKQPAASSADIGTFRMVQHAPERAEKTIGEG
jgi:hypothetical protein